MYLRFTDLEILTEIIGIFESYPYIRKLKRKDQVHKNIKN